MDITPGKPAHFKLDPDTFTYPGVSLNTPPAGTEDVPGWKYVKATEDTYNNARIEAAFQLTAVENLLLDASVKIPIPVKDDDRDVTHQDNFQIAVAGDFTSGDFSIGYGLYGAFGGRTAWGSGSTAQSSKLNPTFDIIVIPSFYVAAIDAKVGAHVGLKAEGKSTTLGVRNDDQSTILGLGGWISRKLGKSEIKTGLAYQFPKYGENGSKGETGYFTWPIILTLDF
jgi:hypothetical protein